MTTEKSLRNDSIDLDLGWGPIYIGPALGVPCDFHPQTNASLLHHRVQSLFRDDGLATQNANTRELTHGR
jgi:hypothetical protein